MFIINPYRYAATGPVPITNFYGAIHTSSLYYTVGLVGLQISGSIHTSSVNYTLGAVSETILPNIYNLVEVFSQGTGSQFLNLDGPIINYVDLRVT